MATNTPVPIDEKSAPTITTTNILTITRPTPSRQPSNQSVLSTIEDVDSTHTLSPSPTRVNDEKNTMSRHDDRENSPSSPFYNPTPTRYSVEVQKSSSKQHITAYETDVEACLTPQQTTKSGALLSKKRTGVSTTTMAQECTVWPGQKQMKKKRKEMKFQRGRKGVCGCMAGLNRKTKIWVKIMMALVIIGLAVGVGVGISKAVGGGVWKNDKSTNTVLSI